MPGTIATRISSRRIALGLSRFELATLCRVNPLFVYRWERGRCTPNLASAVLLARALRVTLDWLVVGRQSRYRGKPRAKRVDTPAALVG